MLKNFKYFESKLFQPVDISSLGMFRFFFGCCLIYLCYFDFDPEFVSYNIASVSTHFPWPLFEFLGLPVFEHTIITKMINVMFICSIAIAFGFFYRIAAILFVIIFGYLFLLDKTWFNNHYYLVLLIGIYLSFLQANRWFSIDAIDDSKSKITTIPYWQIFLLRFQFCLVYFTAGLVKINYDWLVRFQPLSTGLPGRAGAWSEEIWFAGVLSWGGCILDLFIPVLLIFKRTSVFGLLGIVVFNTINLIVWPDMVGFFPVLMILGAVIYLEPDRPRRIYIWIKNKLKLKNKAINEETVVVNIGIKERIITILIILNVVVQALMPWRFILLEGHVDWQRKVIIGAWRMFLRTQEGQIFVTMTDGKTGVRQQVDLNGHINQRQYDGLLSNPDRMIQFMRYLYNHADQFNIDEPTFSLYAEASMNKREPQPYVYGDISAAGEKFIIVPLVPRNPTEEEKAYYQQLQQDLRSIYKIQ